MQLQAALLQDPLACVYCNMGRQFINTLVALVSTPHTASWPADFVKGQ